MRDFQYIAARSLDQAVTQLANAGADGRVLAGGTDVIVQMREGRRHVEVLVDVKGLPETNQLSYDKTTGLRLGAALPCYRIYENKDVATVYPSLVDSASLIGSTGIQGRATLGGNLCNSSPAADSIPTLIALGATCHIAGPNGERDVPVEKFCVAPGSNVLEAGELLVWFDFPAPKANSGARFLRFIPRNEMDIAVVNAAVQVELDESGTTIRRGRVAVGAVAPTPLMLEDAASVVEGKPATMETFSEAAVLARAAARPISDTRGTAAQRKHLVEVMVRRAFEGAVSRARGQGLGIGG